jgi:hypothetical protein
MIAIAFLFVRVLRHTVVKATRPYLDAGYYLLQFLANAFCRLLQTRAETQTLLPRQLRALTYQCPVAELVLGPDLDAGRLPPRRNGGLCAVLKPSSNGFRRT